MHVWKERPRGAKAFKEENDDLHYRNHLPQRRPHIPYRRTRRRNPQRLQQPNTAAPRMRQPPTSELHARKKTTQTCELAIEDAGRGHQRAKLRTIRRLLFRHPRALPRLRRTLPPSTKRECASARALFTKPRYTPHSCDEACRLASTAQVNLLYATPFIPMAAARLSSTVDEHATARQPRKRQR